MLPQARINVQRSRERFVRTLLSQCTDLIVHTEIMYSMKPLAGGFPLRIDYVKPGSLFFLIGLFLSFSLVDASFAYSRGKHRSKLEAQSKAVLGTATRAVNSEEGEERLTARQKKKYADVDVIACYHFDNLEVLDKVKKSYHRVTVPKLIEDIVNLRSPLDNAMFIKYPRSLAWNAEGNFVLVINPRHMPPDELSESIDELKNLSTGLSLVGWYFYPHIMNGSPFWHNYLDHEKVQSVSNSTVKTQTTEYHPRTFDAVEVEEETNLVTIMDLTPKELPYLKDIESMIFRILRETYHVDPIKDQVNLHFHFPYAMESSSLHVHVRVNQASTPLEKAINFPFNEIIHALESGKKIGQVILEKQENNKGCLFSDTSKKYEILETIPGVTTKLINRTDLLKIISI